MHEALDDGLALQGVGDLGVELQRIEAPRLVGHAGMGRRRVRGDGLEPRRQHRDLVAMTHPHVQQAVTLGIDAIVDAIEQPGVAAGANLGIAEFPNQPILDLTTQLGRHGLHAVADAQHRNAQTEHRVGCARRLALGDRRRPAGEDDAGGAETADKIVRDIPGVNLTVDVGLAHTARDELGVLGTEVEDEDAGVDHCGGRGGSGMGNR